MPGIQEELCIFRVSWSACQHRAVGVDTGSHFIAGIQLRAGQLWALLQSTACLGTEESQMVTFFRHWIFDVGILEAPMIFMT
jgi:hypothetical protein